MEDIRDYYYFGDNSRLSLEALGRCVSAWRPRYLRHWPFSKTIQSFTRPSAASPGAVCAGRNGSFGTPSNPLSDTALLHHAADLHHRLAYTLLVPTESLVIN